MDSEKTLDMAFDLSGHLKRTVNEFSIGNPKAYAERMAAAGKNTKEASK